MRARFNPRVLKGWLLAAAFAGLFGGAVYGSGSLPSRGPLGGALGGKALHSSSAAGGPTVTAPAPTASTFPTMSTLAPPPPSSSQRPGAAIRDVIAAYLRFWQVAQTVDRKSPDQWRPILQAVTGEPLLDQLLDGFAAARARGTLQYGTVEPHPNVAYLTSEHASVVDCQDASHSGEIDRNTGTVRQVGAARTPFAAVIARDRNSRWVVTEIRYLAAAC